MKECLSQVAFPITFGEEKVKDTRKQPFVGFLGEGQPSRQSPLAVASPERSLTAVNIAVIRKDTRLRVPEDDDN